MHCTITAAARTTCTTQHTHAHMYMQTHYIHRWTYICTDRHRCKYINTYVHTNSHMYIHTDRHTKGTHRALLILRSASCNTGLLIIRKLPRSVPLRFSILSHYRAHITHTLAYWPPQLNPTSFLAVASCFSAVLFWSTQWECSLTYVSISNCCNSLEMSPRRCNCSSKFALSACSCRH